MLYRLLKHAAKRANLRISRGANTPIQFDDTENSLTLLQKMGIEPRCIIDGGAHLGSFAQTARAIFPKSQIFMVEPQKACIPHLRALAKKDGHMQVDVCLLDEDNQKAVHFIEDGDHPTTGARAAPVNSETGRLVVSRTLDDLYLAKLDHHNNLLKLDLQGHELKALAGAVEILKSKIDFAIIETSCFVEHSEPKTLAIMHMMDINGFDLFDIAAMGRRSRDKRLRQVDLVFAKRGTAIFNDRGWD